MGEPTKIERRDGRGPDAEATGTAAPGGCGVSVLSTSRKARSFSAERRRLAEERRDGAAPATDARPGEEAAARENRPLFLGAASGAGGTGGDDSTECLRDTRGRARAAPDPLPLAPSRLISRPPSALHEAAVAAVGDEGGAGSAADSPGVGLAPGVGLVAIRSLFITTFRFTTRLTTFVTERTTPPAPAAPAPAAAVGDELTSASWAALAPSVVREATFDDAASRDAPAAGEPSPALPERRKAPAEPCGTPGRAISSSR